MSAAAGTANPRRRPARAPSPQMTPSLIDSFQTMSLRKGDTFHPTTVTSADNAFWDPLEAKASSAPARSTTCPKSLEDLLFGAGERRTTDLLARVDRAVKAQSKISLGQILSEPEVLPLPAPGPEETNTNEAGPVRRTTTHRASHGSDSGIGTSVADSEDSVCNKTSETTHNPSNRQSMSSISAATAERGLSNYASEQIYKYIVKPILQEEGLKEFHGLIKDVPHRIGSKEIKNLRDLEKTLIFLAPEFARSTSKYLQFCERTIRVLHTTVTTLHESDQRAPADRPYTQGYFFDLVEQIRRYATILAATRERQLKGEDADKMDYQKDESVSLIGGMSHNGRPAELVRHTADGKTISLATDTVLSPQEVASSSMKRPMSDAFVDDEDALRSMARRKKNAKPEIHGCSICEKEFKRPCDLTKHLKTHERPWKCPQEDCRFHEHGWPTEKERDRHVNDKHSTAPPLFTCHFKDCPYTSKRESNCKQHMEKAHGWEYVRSKNNGKGRASVTRLSKSSVPPSPASVMLTPITPIAPSPSMQSYDSSRRGSMAPPPLAGPSTFGTPAFTDFSPEWTSHFPMDFNSYPITPALTDDRRLSSSAVSTDPALHLDDSPFDDAIAPDDLDITRNFTFGPHDFAFPQQTTPSSVAGPSTAMQPPHTSPGAQLEQTLAASSNYYDGMNLDEGYQMDFSSAPEGDFALFDSTTSPGNNADMYPPLTEGSSWGTFGHQMNPSVPLLASGNSTIEDLFPELKN